MTSLYLVLFSAIAIATLLLLGLSIAEGWASPAVQRRLESWQVLRRPCLIFLTMIAILSLTNALWQSWSEPQIQSRLELYQTNLVLQAAELQDLDARSEASQSPASFSQARNVLLGADPFKEATEQYQEVRKSAQNNLEKFQKTLKTLETQATLTPLESEPPQRRPPTSDGAVQQQQIRKSIQQVQTLIDELDVRLGLLQVQQGNIQEAQTRWQNLLARSSSLADVAQVLNGLWSDPPQLLPNAESQIRKQLDGWFRDRALIHLYQLQQRQEPLISLKRQQQAVAEQSFYKLMIVGSIPAIGFLLGTVLLIFLLLQRLIKGKDAWLAKHEDDRWVTPWNGDVIWQVLILGFFVVGQVLLPTLLAGLFKVVGINPSSFSEQVRAFSVLASYVLLATGGLSVLYISLKPFLPLSPDWFRFQWRSNWIFWGLGGYLAAIPLVILVSLVNQAIWQGQGGSNPILPIALEGKDKVALAVFFVTASIAAPLFEEFMFRGFLLPSLTQYLPVSGAILVSSLLFALAHLNLSEVLPLTVLGMVLGIVYTRSRTLLAPMLLHSLWNSGTLLSLFVLGNGSGVS